MHNHEEMDMLLDVTGAVVGMEESDLSLGREEHLMDKLMEPVLDKSVRLEATSNTSNIGYIGGRRGDEIVVDGWQDDTFFQERIFEEWVELEMEKLNVTMEVGQEQVLVS